MSSRADPITVKSMALIATILFFPLLIGTIKGFDQLMEDRTLATIHDVLLLAWGFGLNAILLRMRARARAGSR